MEGFLLDVVFKNTKFIAVQIWHQPARAIFDGNRNEYDIGDGADRARRFWRGLRGRGGRRLLRRRIGLGRAALGAVRPYRSARRWRLRRSLRGHSRDAATEQ